LWATPAKFNFFLLPDSRSNLSHSDLAAVAGVLQRNQRLRFDPNRLLFSLLDQSFERDRLAI
jgi:hypothetical protein